MLEGHSNAIHKFWVVLIVLLVGVALICAFVILTYVVSVLTDKYLSTLMEDIDSGIMARKAGLWGLTETERIRLLQEIFERQAKTTLVYTKNATEPVCGDDFELVDSSIVPDCHSGTEGVASVVNPNNEILEHTNGPTLNVVETASHAVKLNDAEDQTRDLNDHEPSNPEVPIADKADVMNDADHKHVCCICLAEYEEGDKLMSGTQCNHLFHYNCSFRWMQKHDHCPYCRKEMCTSHQMKTAALQVLGGKRYEELVSIGNDQNQLPSNETRIMNYSQSSASRQSTQGADHSQNEGPGDFELIARDNTSIDTGA
jgi:hypothetical protein